VSTCRCAPEFDPDAAAVEYHRGRRAGWDESAAELASCRALLVRLAAATTAFLTEADDVGVVTATRRRQALADAEYDAWSYLRPTSAERTPQ
jgi:hypothetical protein